MTIKRRNKLPKRLKERCKKLRIRITKVRNGKRVYKTKKDLLQEYKKRLKRKSKFGTQSNNNSSVFDDYYDDIISINTNNGLNWRDTVTPSYISIHRDELNQFITKVIDNNNIDNFKQYLEAILFIAILLDRQILIAADILKDSASDRLYTGTKGMKMLFDRLMFHINNNENVFFNNLRPDFSHLNNIITQADTRAIFLKDFVYYIQTQTRSTVKSWLQTFFNSKELSSKLFEKLIGRKLHRRTPTSIISTYNLHPEFINGINWSDLDEYRKRYHRRLSTLDGQLHYENYIKYKVMTSDYIFDNTTKTRVDNNGTLRQITIDGNTITDLKKMKKAVIDLQNTNTNRNINLFSLIDGSYGGDTSKFNKNQVISFHNRLFGIPQILLKYFPTSFTDLRTVTTLQERTGVISNCAVLGLQDSDFMYSLQSPPNTQRTPFYFKTSKKFTICTGIPGLEGKICIAQTNPRIPGVRRDYTQHVVRDFLYNNGTNPTIQDANFLPGYPVVKPNAGFVPTAEGLYRYPPNHTGQGLYYIQSQKYYQEVYASELVLENEHISKWVCLKVAGTVTKFKNVVLGYLNNFSINGILERNLSDIGNYQFDTNPRQPSFLPDGMLGNIISDPKRLTWGFIKVMPKSMFGNGTLIPDQYVYQKSTTSYGTLVWYIPNELKEIKYMFICNEFPTNGFIDGYSRVLQYNVIYDTDFQERLLLSLWNYKRILDPLQYLGLRQETLNKKINGVFATQDFLCFLQCLYLRMTNKDNNIDIIWQKDENSLITATSFGTIKKKEKDIDTLIKEILKELDIEKYFDFAITVLDDGKVGIKHFINPYVLEQYYENSLVKKNMDTILRKLGCKSFSEQTREFENKEPRTEERQIKKRKRIPNQSFNLDGPDDDFNAFKRIYEKVPSTPKKRRPPKPTTPGTVKRPSTPERKKNNTIPGISPKKIVHIKNKKGIGRNLIGSFNTGIVPKNFNLTSRRPFINSSEISVGAYGKKKVKKKRKKKSKKKVLIQSRRS